MQVRRVSRDHSTPARQVRLPHFGRAHGDFARTVLSGAARVYVTLDELSAMLELPPGHRLHAVDELPGGYCPGLALTIVSDDDSAGPKLPRYKATDPLIIVDMASYRRWGSDHGRVTRTVLREVDTPLERAVPRYDDHQDERRGRPGKRVDPTPLPLPYVPATPPVMQSFTLDVTKNWPKFPGEDLPITGDPGDEPDHMGGPR